MKRQINVKRTLRTAALLFSIMGLVSGSSAVSKLTSSYSCCNLTVLFDPSCENTWRMEDKDFISLRIHNKLSDEVLWMKDEMSQEIVQNFAYINHPSEECVAPCKAIKDDRMILDSCWNVTDTTVCTTTMGTAEETQHTYLGRACSQPLSGRMSPAQGSVGLLLPAVIWMASVLN